MSSGAYRVWGSGKYRLGLLYILAVSTFWLAAGNATLTTKHTWLSSAPRTARGCSNPAATPVPRCAMKSAAYACVMLQMWLCPAATQPPSCPATCELCRMVTCIVHTSNITATPVSKHGGLSLLEEHLQCNNPLHHVRMWYPSQRILSIACYTACVASLRSVVLVENW